MYIVHAFRACIPRMYSAHVFRACIPRMHSAQHPTRISCTHSVHVADPNRIPAHEVGSRWFTGRAGGQPVKQRLRQLFREGGASPDNLTVSSPIYRARVRSVFTSLQESKVIACEVRTTRGLAGLPLASLLEPDQIPSEARSIPAQFPLTSRLLPAPAHFPLGSRSDPARIPLGSRSDPARIPLGSRSPQVLARAAGLYEDSSPLMVRPDPLGDDQRGPQRNPQGDAGVFRPLAVPSAATPATAAGCRVTEVERTTLSA